MFYGHFHLCRWVSAFLGAISLVLFLPSIFQEIDVSAKERQHAQDLQQNKEGIKVFKNTLKNYNKTITRNQTLELNDSEDVKKCTNCEIKYLG